MKDIEYIPAVEKVVTEETPAKIILTLTLEETAAIYMLLGSTGGYDGPNGVRDRINTVYSKLCVLKGFVPHLDSARTLERGAYISTEAQFPW